MDTEELEEIIRGHLAGGNALSACDAAAWVLERGLAASNIRYLYVLSLAAAGATQRALTRYEELAPPLEERNEDWLALPARLHKDLAFAGIEPARNLPAAANLYAAAHQRTGGTFSGANAATLHLLAGDRDAARRLAASVLADLGETPPTEERAAYYWHATRAETLLVLGREAEAATALRDANPLIRGDLTTRSRTRQQVGRILEKEAMDPSLQRVIELPCVYLFDAAGAQAAAPLPPELGARISGSPVFMAMPATPAALSAAAELKRAGARIHVATPAEETRLRDRRLAALNDAGLGEFLAGVDRQSVLPGFLDGESEWRDQQAQRLAHGLARAAAAAFCTDLLALRAESGRAARWATGPQPAPLEPHAPGTRRMVGLVFGDVVGFSKFSDEDIRTFWQQIVPEFAAVIGKWGSRVLRRQTWGDAVHVVTADTPAAAHIALDLLEVLRLARTRHTGKLGQLEMRIGAHFAPAFRGYDAIENAPTFFGTQLSFTARVEPVTPPGTVYVTESFLSELELECPGVFRGEYAGELPLAKSYGVFRLCSLKQALGRAAAAPQGTVLTVGVTGHLGLDAPARERVRAALAPVLRQRLGPGARVRLLTGLAPGADLLLTELVAEAVQSIGGNLSVHALLVADPDTMIAQWLRRATELGDEPSAAARSAVRETLAHWLSRASAREHLDGSGNPFQELAARLACEPDLLIAVLRGSHAGKPGGTAEVVDWRRAPSNIPEGLGSGTAASSRELIVVDPDAGSVSVENASPRTR